MSRVWDLFPLPLFRSTFSLTLKSMSNKPQVWSCGGGTQSCATGVLICQGRLPKPDLSVISDTGRENPATWQYLDSVLRPNLAKVGVELIRISKDEWATPRGRQIFATSGQLMLPAYTNQSGEASKLSAFCSAAWKQEVIDRWISLNRGIVRSEFVKWIGFSRDEARRIIRMQQGEEWAKGLIWFPLVQGVPLTRHESIKLVENAGWPKPPRSRCWMCPNQSDMEWSEIKADYPELFEKACAMDEEIRLTDPHAFLHASVKPLRSADLNPKDDLFSAGCASGECFL